MSRAHRHTAPPPRSSRVPYPCPQCRHHGRRAGGLRSGGRLRVGPCGGRGGRRPRPSQNVTLSFVAESESASAGITKLRVILPKGLAPGDITYKEGPKDWKFTAGDDGYTVAGPAVPAGEDAEYAVNVRQLPDAKSLPFKTLQSYSDGRIDRWIELEKSADGGHAASAPVLTRKSAESGAEPVSPSAEPTTPAPTTPAPTPSAAAETTTAASVDEKADDGAQPPRRCPSPLPSWSSPWQAAHGGGSGAARTPPAPDQGQFVLDESGCRSARCGGAAAPQRQLTAPRVRRAPLRPPRVQPVLHAPRYVLPQRAASPRDDPPVWVAGRIECSGRGRRALPPIFERFTHA